MNKHEIYFFYVLYKRNNTTLNLYSIKIISRKLASNMLKYNML